VRTTGATSLFAIVLKVLLAIHRSDAVLVFTIQMLPDVYMCWIAFVSICNKFINPRFATRQHV